MYGNQPLPSFSSRLNQFLPDHPYVLYTQLPMAQPNVTSHLQDAMDGNTDLVSWVFANQGYDQHRKIYIDTEDPTRSLSAAKARTTVTKLIAGFKAVGLKKGDCVCVHAFNDVSSLYSRQRGPTTLRDGWAVPWVVLCCAVNGTYPSWDLD